MDLNRKKTSSAEVVTEQMVEVELNDCLHERKETSAPADLPGPTPFGAWPQITVGGAIFTFAVVGIGFFFMLPTGTSPIFLLAPFMVAALGLTGLLFGLMTLSDQRS
jgi:hypothetical protein